MRSNRDNLGNGSCTRMTEAFYAVILLLILSFFLVGQVAAEDGIDVETVPLLPHSGEINSLAYSPDGHFIVSTAHGDSELKLWNPESGRLIRGFKGRLGDNPSVAVSPDGRFIAAASSNGLALFDAKTLKLIRSFAVPPVAFAFTPDANSIVWAESNGVIKIWNLRSGAAQKSFKCNANISAISIHPNSRMIVVAGIFEPKAKMFDLTSGKLLQTFEDPPHLGLVPWHFLRMDDFWRLSGPTPS